MFKTHAAVAPKFSKTTFVIIKYLIIQLRESYYKSTLYSQTDYVI